jgi:hypothetical protein
MSATCWMYVNEFVTLARGATPSATFLTSRDHAASGDLSARRAPPAIRHDVTRLEVPRQRVVRILF